MLEKVGPKVFLIGLVSLISVLLLVLKVPPFTMGLDLSGGTRITYEIDLDQAYKDGDLVEGVDRREEVMSQVITIMRERIDPKGVLSPTIRLEGDNRIVVELPGRLGTPTEEKQTALSVALADTVGDGGVILVDDANGWPDTGVITINEESLRYGTRAGNQLGSIERQYNATALASHAEGSQVTLVGNDAFRAALESLGELKFLIDARNDLPEGTDYATEQGKLSAWAEEHPGRGLSPFNALSPENGGPHPDLLWLPWSAKTEADKLQPETSRAVLLLKPKPEWDFKGEDLARVFPSQDRVGFPAVGFEFKDARKGDFQDFTKEYKNRPMAIVLNGQIDTMPTINKPLPGGGIIEGKYTIDEMRALLTVFRSGSLKVKPKLLDDERVSATLGADYIKNGAYAGGLSIVILLVFIVFYYKRLGVFAAISLGMSFLLLMGGLSFLNATLTLPGIAGLILTLGMAVDANILIFDRIREEREKGRNIKQAAKEGFDKSMPAILDANVTTFLTAFILYQVGTGPLRGFAVTLMCGILTSVFAALMITRVLVHFSLAKGAQDYPMGTWMVTASYKFMAKSKTAILGSLALVVISLGLFLSSPNTERFGIDFVGGVETKLQMAGPTALDTVRQRVKAMGGEFASAEVKGVENTASGDGYTQFRVSIKESKETNVDEQVDVKGLIQRELADILLAQGAKIEMGTGTTEVPVTVTLQFSEGHPTEDVKAVLSSIGLQDAKINADPSQALLTNQYVVSGKTVAGISVDAMTSELETAFANAKDSTGKPYNFAQAIPSYSAIGAQVVGDLRDQALIAMVVSLFAIIMYIRVRFAEYSWGFAAVAALTHDVFITLGALMIANKVGLLNGEITLSMIGAFLTIIGYSLNDTIVIFDRVRENLPRTKKSLSDVLDLSINQTLSRTVLTSFTTFMTVTVLYAFNFGTGNVLESFAFAMMIGVLTGTYSTIMIANPVFLYIEKRSGRLDATGRLTVAGSAEAKAAKKASGGSEALHV